jgi:hypothetical protein
MPVTITVQNNEITGFNINGPANYAAEVAAGDSILLRGGERFVGCAVLNAVNVPSRGSAARPLLSRWTASVASQFAKWY